MRQQGHASNRGEIVIDFGKKGCWYYLNENNDIIYEILIDCS